MSNTEPPSPVVESEQFLRAEVFESAPESSYEESTIVWPNIAIYSILHLAALYGGLLFFTEASWALVAFSCVVHAYAGLGITAGAHRLWAHRSYKARFPLRVFLILANVLAFQNDVIEWSRDHRGHHKWSETSADPHNAKRGPFFSHVGWLLVRKHPDVIRKGRTVDLDDLYADPVLRWQRRNYYSLALILCVLFPTLAPHLLWGESLWVAFYVSTFRYVFLLHSTWCVNSLAHMIGNKPYDPTISPTQSRLTSFLAIGEGWHNFHHTFPQDYRASEFPWTLNATTLFLDAAALLGLVYDRKITQQTKVEDRKEKTRQMKTRHTRQRSTG